MLISFDELSNIRLKHKKSTIVLGSGVFDLLHRGHVEYLQGLRKYGDIVVVMVKSDERVKLGKGSLRPVIAQQNRAAMVDAIKGVDYTFIAPHFPFTGGIENDQAYKAALEALKPVVFHTTNPVWKVLESTGAKVVVTARIESEPLRSTTSIIEHVVSKFK